MTERTGPKISSWARRSMGAMSRKIVGAKKWPFARWPSRTVAPPTISSPSVRPISTYPATFSTAAGLMSGPTSTDSSRPEPSFSVLVRRSSRSSNGSTAARSTTTRLVAVQRWPVVPNADQRMPSVARSRSASAMTMMPFLPPSSRLSRFSRRPAISAIRRPVVGRARERHDADVGVRRGSRRRPRCQRR